MVIRLATGEPKATLSRRQGWMRMHKEPGKGLITPLWLGLCLLLASCTAPERPKPEFSLRDQAPLAGLPDSAPGWPAANWWQHFHDPQLDKLMATAMAGAPTLDVAMARYRQASSDIARKEADKNIEITGYGTAGYSLSDIDADAGNSHINNTTQGVAAIVGARLSWDLDLWGKKEAALKQAIDTAHAQKASQAAALSALQYNLSALYFQWQAIAARLKVSQGSLATANEYLRVVKARVDAGVEEEDSLDKARAQLAQIRQQQAMLAGQQRIIHAQIAALMGISSQQLGALEVKPLPTPAGALPADAGLGLIGRRPDIVAARWQVEAASQGIEQARAAYYPNISLSGLAGFLKSFPDLGSGDDAQLTLGTVGPSISLPIFEAGRLDAAFAASNAQLNSAIANYNQTVVQAAAQVARQVLTLGQLTDAAGELQKRWLASRSQYQRASLRVKQGVDDPRQALGASLELDSQTDSQLQLTAQRLDAQLQLIHELGGGYQEPAPTATDNAQPAALEDSP